MNLLVELYQFGLVLSMVFILFVVVNFIIRLYGRFVLNHDTKFPMGNIEKSLLLIAISYIITFLI